MTSYNNLRIAFRPLGGDRWLGGSIFAGSLLSAIREHCRNSASLHLVTGQSSLVDAGSARLYDSVIRLPEPPRFSPKWFVENGAKAVFRTNLQGNRLLADERIDVLAFDMGLRFTVPSIPWLPDFQHRHMPEMFSHRERIQRDRAFGRIAKRAPLIILQTEAVAREFGTFYPGALSKARVLTPVCDLPPDTWTTDPTPACSRHNLPKRFIYLPNQFWKHKNHLVAFRAISAAKQRGTRISLVCSGLQGDYRHPGYYSELLAEISALGIEDQLFLPGVIPRRDVFSLIRQSICLLNPSISEGFGMTIDEARSIGKQVLISDIPVHREHEAPKAAFFNPHDVDELAGQMIDLWKNSSEGPDAELEADAGVEHRRRRKQYAEGFLAIAAEARSRGSISS